MKNKKPRSDAGLFSCLSSPIQEWETWARRMRRTTDKGSKHASSGHTGGMPWAVSGAGSAARGRSWSRHQGRVGGRRSGNTRGGLCYARHTRGSGYPVPINSRTDIPVLFRPLPWGQAPFFERKERGERNASPGCRPIPCALRSLRGRAHGTPVPIARARQSLALPLRASLARSSARRHPRG